MNDKAKKKEAARARRRLVARARNAAVVLVLCGIGVVGLTAYKRAYDVSHDLSVVGNGTPTVVQVHDTSCRLCQSLRGNVDSVKGEFEDRIQFRIADIHTPAGAAFARRYDVPHVTLLLFDGEGELVTVLSGVREPDSLRPSFRSLLQATKRQPTPSSIG